MKHSLENYTLHENAIGEIWIYCKVCDTYTFRMLLSGSTIRDLLNLIEDHERAIV